MSLAALLVNWHCSDDEPHLDDQFEPFPVSIIGDIDLDRFIDDGNPIYRDEVAQRKRSEPDDDVTSLHIEEDCR